jgi:hypothetical protein
MLSPPKIGRRSAGSGPDPAITPDLSRAAYPVCSPTLDLNVSEWYNENEHVTIFGSAYCRSESADREDILLTSDGEGRDGAIAPSASCAACRYI